MDLVVEFGGDHLVLQERSIEHALDRIREPSLPDLKRP